jgi:hypothetical protein
MNFFNKFFSNNDELATDYRDWLLNGIDELNESKMTTLKDDPFGHLMMFTTKGTYSTGALLCHKEPKIASEIKNVLCRIRGFYDCLWQCYLLKNNENSKIGNLYGQYFVLLENLIEGLWYKSPNAKLQFSPAFGKYYEENYLMDDVKKYIQEEPSNEKRIELLTSDILEICKLPDNSKNYSLISGAIKNYLDDEKINSHLELFDIEKVILLPDSFFKN